MLCCAACRCLQHYKDQKEFGRACRREVQQYESSASQDYRLNFRLKKECKTDIDTLCKDACHPGKSSEVSEVSYSNVCVRERVIRGVLGPLPAAAWGSCAADSNRCRSSSAYGCEISGICPGKL